MSRFKIEITNGVKAGRLVEIGDEPVVFGRTDESDVVLSDDKMTSSKHFKLSVEEGQLWIHDLESTNGTLVNGERVSGCQVAEGDWVQAGHTRFRVRIAADVPPPTAEPQAVAATHFNPFETLQDLGDASGQDQAVPEVTAPRQSLKALPATLHECPAGWTCFTGHVPEDVTIADVLEHVGELTGIYWVIDFSHLEQALPEGVDVEASNLFQWLPPVAAGYAPQLLAAGEFSLPREAIENGWGCDAIVVVQSDLEKPELLAALRQLIQDPSQPGAKRGISGCCWPTVLTALLEHNTYGFAETFSKLVNLVVVEASDPRGWRMFATEKVLDQVKQLGVQAEATETHSDAPAVSGVDT